MEAFRSELPGPLMVSWTSVFPVSFMCSEVRSVSDLKTFPFDHARTLSTSPSERVEERRERREVTVVPLPTPERPTIVITRPEVEGVEGRDDIIIDATSSGVLLSTVIVVVGAVERSESERTPVDMERAIPAESMEPSSASRDAMAAPSDEEKVRKDGFVDRL